MPESANNYCEPTSTQSMKLTAKVKAGGCAAKINASELAQIVQQLPPLTSPNLLTSISTFEDAAVYKISDDLALIQTVDFFPPVVDDPRLFGKIAAVNALSDIYAMGAEPTLALAILCFPVCDFPLSVASEILAGGAEALAEAGVALGGGHSIQSTEPIYGLCVSGFLNAKHILTNGNAKDKDALVLTKPIGSGSLLLGLKGEMIADESRKLLISKLTELNKHALLISRDFDVHAATDVTGFGLIGHAHEMSKASGLSCLLEASQIPLLPEAKQLAEQGFVTAGAYANRTSYEAIASIDASVDLSMSDLLFDPQTSGGLLFSLPNEQAEQLVDKLKEAGLTGAIIGRMKDGEPGRVEVQP